MKRIHTSVLPVFFLIALAAVPGIRSVHADDERSSRPPVNSEGTVHIPAFDLPESSFLNGESRAELARERVPAEDAFTIATNACPRIDDTRLSDVARLRLCQEQSFEATRFYRKLRARYPVTVTTEKIGGVDTQVFVPEGGVAPGNRDRVLFDLHGGSFYWGSRTNSQVESIPIASVARIKVISIDYRLAPEYIFPAASEDVAAVYRAILKRYVPRNVGIYGCSAGSALAAQSIAWFVRHHLPLPGAVGLFCYGAGRAQDASSERWVHSDSAYIVGAMTGTYRQFLKPFPYYRGVDVHSPLVSPGDDDTVMAQFPPTLLISGTRDYLLSSVVSTHSQLTRLGVSAELHVWEGMQHAFMYYPELPESREAYEVTARFFARYLGSSSLGKSQIQKQVK